MRGRDEMDGQPYRARMRDPFESMEPMGIKRHRWASREAELSGSERVNTASIRGLTKLVKITEDVRNSLPNKRSLRKKRCRLASNRRQRNSTKPELRSTRKRKVVASAVSAEKF